MESKFKMFDDSEFVVKILKKHKIVPLEWY